MTGSPLRPRVVVADDDVLLREGIAGLLERAGFEIAGQAGDAAELLDVVREQRPQLVIVDIRMPPNHETEGLDAARVIRRELPEVGILVLSAHAEATECFHQSVAEAKLDWIKIEFAGFDFRKIENLVNHM